VLLAALFLPTLATIGLTAVGGDIRFTHALSWQNAALVAALFFLIHDRLTNTPQRLDPLHQIPLPPPSPRSLFVLGLGLFVVFGLGLTKALWNRIQKSGDPAPQVMLSGQEAEGWIDRALLDEGRVFLPLKNKLVVRTTIPRKGHTRFLEKHTDINVYAEFLKPRAYAFTTFDARPPLPEATCVFPGPLLQDFEDQEVVIVGVPLDRGDYFPSLESIAVFVGGQSLRPSREASMAHLAFLLAHER
jgi:hypothetical protein